MMPYQQVRQQTEIFILYMDKKMAEIKKVIKNWTTYDVLNSDTVGSALTAGDGINITSNTISVAGVERVFTLPSVWGSIADALAWVDAGGSVVFRIHDTIWWNEFNNYFRVVNWNKWTGTIKACSDGTDYNYTYIITYSGTTVSTRDTTTSDYIPTWWTNWQVLTNVNWVPAWANPTWWLQVSPNSTITGIKYVWYGTESDYQNLQQYYTDVAWDTEFHTF